MLSNHTTIGASVKSDVGEKHTVILYNHINRHAGTLYKHRNKKHDKLG